MTIKKGDMVEVITGDDAGTSAKRRIARVLSIVPGEDKIVVEGVNKVYRHLKPNRRNAQGGRLSKEMPISVSNVKLVCSTCQRGVRVGKRYTADGRKERYCKKCGGSLGGFLSKARAAYAQKPV
jgi:large subunit ribosomal protein L24